MSTITKEDLEALFGPLSFLVTGVIATVILAVLRRTGELFLKRALLPWLRQPSETWAGLVCWTLLCISSMAWLLDGPGPPAGAGTNFFVALLTLPLALWKMMLTARHLVVTARVSRESSRGWWSAYVERRRGAIAAPRPTRRT